MPSLPAIFKCMSLIARETAVGLQTFDLICFIYPRGGALSLNLECSGCSIGYRCGSDFDLKDKECMFLSSTSAFQTELELGALHLCTMVLFFKNACVPILLVLLLQIMISHGAETVFPPVGNSLYITSTTLDGTQSYICSGGKWMPFFKRATLVDITNRSLVIGSYALRNYARPKYAGIWSLVNSDGDQAETGHVTSRVGGKQIALIKGSLQNLPDFLARASIHQYDGAASRVSYIAQRHSTGGVPSGNGSCDIENMTTSVNFKASFLFWTQDLEPPAVPNLVAVPSTHERPVEGFFGQGWVAYAKNGQNWTQMSVTAKLYDVPGGLQAGEYLVKSVANVSSGLPGRRLSCLATNDPNGFQICGDQATDAVLVTPGALPWTLIAVTSSTGNTAILGPFTFVQMVSTWGGLPPPPSLNSSHIWRSPFTAILWLYTNQGT